MLESRNVTKNMKYAPLGEYKKRVYAIKKFCISKFFSPLSSALPGAGTLPLYLSGSLMYWTPLKPSSYS